ncbi:MAG: peptidoglycan-binding protein [Candidatus Devosia euplotis]|nr:peptidoglycan-binding protein [Candidatus Devosia euplotis]
MQFDKVCNLQLAISQYEPFVAVGGWEEIPQESYDLTLGNSKSAVIALERRLISSDDMGIVENVNDVFDAATDAGVRKFQARRGLNIKGHVDEATWCAMAASIAPRRSWPVRSARSTSTRTGMCQNRSLSAI